MTDEDYWDIVKYSDLGPDPYIPPMAFGDNADDDCKTEKQHETYVPRKKHKDHDWIIYVVIVLSFALGLLIRRYGG